MSDDRADRLRRRAEQIINDRSADAAPIESATLKEVVQELYIHQAELEVQNEELRASQQALEASRQEYAQLFQSLPLACFTVNAAGIVGEANAAAERQFGLPHRRLRGRPLTLLVESVDHARLFTALQRLRDTGQWSRQEYRFTGSHGVLDGLTDARPVSFDDGDRGDILVTLTDVTERNTWMREVQASRDEAERARSAYHHILQSVADAILGLDAEGMVTFANAAAETLTGWRAGELAGTPIGRIFVGDGSSEGSDAVTASLADGHPRTVGFQRVRRKSGAGVPTEITVSPIVEHSRITGGVLALRDITARLSAESALRTSEERHRTVVRALHDGLVLHDADGRVLLANGMAERLLAGPAAALLDPLAPPLKAGRSRADGVSTEDRRFLDGDGRQLAGPVPAAEALATGQPVRERVIGITRAEGTTGTVWLRVSSHPMAGDAGQVESIVSSVTDITASKALERELAIALDAKERFIASTSHDLRQPVQAMLLLAGLVLKQELPPSARRIAEQLRDTVVSLGGMLDAMLDIARLEAGLITPAVEPVALGPMMERLHREYAALGASRDLKVITVPTRLTLESDGALLERIVRNLLSNALRYTQQGRVLFGVRRRGGAIRIEVWDTGIGIAEDQIDRVFEDYYQVGNAARNRREGLGMGLSIARRVAAMLGGSVDATSTLGRGSCFTITLPLTARAAADALAGAPQEAGAPARTDALVLLVEDDVVIRMALGLMLEDWGYRVVDAGSVGEAVERIDGGLVPDLMLVDYRLPDGETGLMLLDRARARLGRALPGVLLTGDTSSDRLREAAAAQCALLHKPIDPELLQRTVRASLRPQGSA